MGVPCVASSIALKGLAYIADANVLIADTPEKFAEKCICLLTDFKLNERLGGEARKLCLERYTWESKWPAIRKAYMLEGHL